MKQNVIILLAEDNLGHAKLTKKHLKRAGIRNTIVHFNNGKELMDFLKKSNSSGTHLEEGLGYVIIMDLKMPQLDGYEALKRLKQNRTFSVIPTIMYSTSDDPKEIFQCYQEGCNGYIVKPVMSKDFSNFMKKLVNYFEIIEIPKVIKSTII